MLPSVASAAKPAIKNLRISDVILAKLHDKHSVTRREAEQCFENKCGQLLMDDREEHRSDPPTLWFVAPTNSGRLLKVIFIFKDGQVYLRSAYDANEAVQSLYEKHGQ